MALLLILGPRVSEIAAADGDDLAPHQARGGTVEWRWRIVGKGGKVRTVPLSPWLLERHRDYQQVRPQPNERLSAEQAEDARRALVLSARGTRINVRDVQRLLQRAPGRVGQVEPDLARKVTPHACRHTAASIMLSKGWSAKAVSYTHLDVYKRQQ